MAAKRELINTGSISDMSGETREASSKSRMMLAGRSPRT